MLNCQLWRFFLFTVTLTTADNYCHRANAAGTRVWEAKSLDLKLVHI